MDQTNKSSNRSFGVVFFIVFLIISLYPILNYGEIRLWALIISSIFLILGLVNSKLLSPLIKTQLALLTDDKFSLKGPEGITKPFPINCFELKHKIERSGLIEKS